MRRRLPNRQCVRQLCFVMSRGILFSCLLLAFVFASCGKAPPPTQSQAQSKTNLQTYQAFGVVLAVRTDGKTVQIKHEEIPGYMKPMTMDFEVRDTSELRDVEAGDSISFRVLDSGKDGWIDQIKKLDAPKV